MSNKGFPWLLFVLIVFALTWAFDQGWPSSEIPELEFVQEPCAPTSPKVVANSFRRRDNEIAILSFGAVHLRVCQAGVLSFTARGTYAAGHGAHLVVSLNGHVLWEGEVLEPRDFAISVPEAGWLMLAFVNDRVEPPDDRNLWIINLAFEPHTN